MTCSQLFKKQICNFMFEITNQTNYHLNHAFQSNTFLIGTTHLMLMIMHHRPSYLSAECAWFTFSHSLVLHALMRLLDKMEYSITISLCNSETTQNQHLPSYLLVKMSCVSPLLYSLYNVQRIWRWFVGWTSFLNHRNSLQMQSLTLLSTQRLRCGWVEKGSHSEWQCHKCEIMFDQWGKMQLWSSKVGLCYVYVLRF